jgi:hypothetical protein
MSKARTVVGILFGALLLMLAAIVGLFFYFRLTGSS